jgi:replicative DNA helicase
MTAPTPHRDSSHQPIPGPDPRVLPQDDAAAYDAPTFHIESLITELRNTDEGVPTGWNALDTLGVRFRPKELALLAARTGHGKTSALVNIAMRMLERSAAAGSSKPLLYYSHEEPPEHILCRLIALLAIRPIEPWTVGEIREHFSGKAAANPNRNDADYAQLDGAVARLKQVEDRIIVIHRPAWTAAQIADHARTIHERTGVGGVYIDYLQRVPVVPPLHARDQEIALTGRTLKTLAVDVSAPVVAGAQVDRDVIPEGYQDKVRKAAAGSIADAIEIMKAARPDLNHLREGGSEQEADLILGLMNFAADLRVEATGVQASTDHYEIGVLKNRYGPTGKWAELSYSGSSGLISDVGATVSPGDVLARLSA